ncbi:hypothetical protein ACOME3_004230 [Neoechinorhynchus agilis]
MLQGYHASATVPSYRLTEGDLVNKETSRVRLHRLRTHLLNQGVLHVDAAKYLLKAASRILRREPNVIEIDCPVVIVGDIHGQFYDLLNIIEKIDFVNENVLFLGDYVDRGYFSVEVLLYLCALKCRYPRTVRLLRGNHESRKLTSFFTFRHECLFKLNESCYDAACEMFNALPLAAVVNKQIFCVHGCISPHMTYVEDILLINRFVDVPKRGIMCDLLWADPVDQNKLIKGEYAKNNELCDQRNGLLGIIRAHQVPNEGFDPVMKSSSMKSIPDMLTLFSAPNYCDVYKNMGAIARHNGQSLTVSVFKQVEHPYVLPNFLNIFQWALPFMLSQFNEMLRFLTANGAKHLSDALKRSVSPSKEMDERISLSRSNSEAVLKLAGITPTDYTPMRNSSLLNKLKSSASLDENMTYDRIRILDQSNERWK